MLSVTLAYLWGAVCGALGVYVGYRGRIRMVHRTLDAAQAMNKRLRDRYASVNEALALLEGDDEL